MSPPPVPALKLVSRGSVRMESGDVGPPDAVYGCEYTADEDLAVRLQRDGLNRAVKLGVVYAGIEACVSAAIGIEPGNTFSDQSFHRLEGSSNENSPVWLHYDGMNLSVDS